MNDPYEDKAVWCTVDKDSGSIRIGSTMLDKARRLADNHSFFVARWDRDACQWVKAPEPPATVMVEMTVEDVEWLADMDRDLNDDVRRFAVACRKALDAKEAT